MCIAAEKEYGLEKALVAMKEEWAGLEFQIRAYKDTGTFLVTGVDEILTLLDDHIVKTQTMRGSPYVQPIESECKVGTHPTALLTITNSSSRQGLVSKLFLVSECKLSEQCAFL